MSESTHHPEDSRAAYTGLIIGLVALVVIVFTIVKLTNLKFGAHTKPAAEASK